MFTTVKSFGIMLLIWAFALGAVSILPFVVLFVYVPELYATRIRSTAFGFSYNSGRVFAALAAVFGGQIIAACGGSYAVGAGTVASVYLIGAAASFFMPKTNGTVERHDMADVKNTPSTAPALALLSSKSY